MIANGLLVVFIGYVIVHFVYFLPSYIGAAVAFIGLRMVWKERRTESVKYAMLSMGVLTLGYLSFALYYSQTEIVLTSLMYILSLFVLNVVQLLASVCILSAGAELYQEMGMEPEREKLEKNRKVYLLGFAASLAVHLISNFLGIAKGILIAGVTVTFLSLWFLIMLISLRQKVRNYTAGARPMGGASPAGKGASVGGGEEEILDAEYEEEWDGAEAEAGAEDDAENDAGFFADPDEEDFFRDPGEAGAEEGLEEEDPALRPRGRQGRQGQPLD